MQEAPSTPEGETQPEDQHDVNAILTETHGTRVFRLSDALQILALFLVIGVAVWAINTQDEKLVQFSEWIEGLGFLGVVIFFLLLVWVSMPFGYNWSTTVVLVGFAYGWVSMILTNVGTIAGAVFAYYTSRYFMRSCMQHRVSKLSTKKRLYLAAVTQVIESGRGGFIMQILLRLQPVQTTGLTNAFFGVFTTIPMWKYILTTILGNQHAIVLLTSIGIMVRDVGSLEEAANTETGRLNLLVTIGICVISVVSCLIFARYVAVHVIPKLIQKDAVVSLTTASKLDSSSNDGASNAHSPSEVAHSPSESHVVLPFADTELPGVAESEARPDAREKAEP